MTITDALSVGLPKRRGRRLSPIFKDATAEHREWLVPLRQAYIESGLSYRKLKCLALTSEAQLSRLLTGAEDYPDLVRVLDVYTALSTVVEPAHPVEWYQKTWEAGAWAAKRPDEWIKDCIARVAKKPDCEADRGTPGTATEPKSPFTRFPRAVSCLAGMISTALLAYVLQLFGVDLPGASAPATPDREVCGRYARCLVDSGGEPPVISVPVPVSDGRQYVAYPPPTPSEGAPAFVRMWLSKDAPVYDNRRELRKFGSRSLYVSAGSTVYVQCKDEKNYLVVYGGEGDRLRPDTVRRWTVDRLDRLHRVAPADPVQCPDEIG
ncbi:hypothetical protein [Streptomyces iakyrus]